MFILSACESRAITDSLIRKEHRLKRVYTGARRTYPVCTLQGPRYTYLKTLFKSVVDTVSRK